MLSDYLRLGDDRIEVRHVRGERGFAKQAFTTLSAKIDALTTYFGVTEPLRMITVVLVPDRNEFDRLVRDLLRVEIEVPSHPARIAQPQRTDMVVLSPSAYEEHSVYRYVPEDFERLLVHELVHMIEEALSPDIEASPRWWGEGLAVHLSDQWRDEDEFRQPALSGIVDGTIPGFDDIERDTALAYAWGWTIVRFIEAEYGAGTVARIVGECEDGDVFAFVEGGRDSAEEHWTDWLLRGGLEQASRQPDVSV